MTRSSSCILSWGELAELRAGDLDAVTGMLTVARTVAELRPKYHPAGGWFLVKAYPKNRQFRRVKLTIALAARIAAYAAQRQLSPQDLLFTAPRQPANPALRTVLAEAVPDATAPNKAGRRYRHGTLTGYSIGGCHCHYCRGAYARYRAARRAAGKDHPRPGRTLDTDGHIPRDWFRQRNWKPALQAAGITRRIRVQDLRHAHASWALAGGADLQTIRERLGHAGLRAAERYLHTLPNAGDAALAAYRRTRSKGGYPAQVATPRPRDHHHGQTITAAPPDVPTEASDLRQRWWAILVSNQ
jgi:integrase